MKNINKQQIVNTLTGEVVATIGDGDRIKVIKKNTIAYLKKKKESISVPYYNYFYANASELMLIAKELTDSETVFLFRISPYINIHDCCLKLHSGDDITIEMLPDITGLNRNTVYSVIKSLSEKLIIGKWKSGRTVQTYVNPWIFKKGNHNNPVLRNMFKKYYIRSLQTTWENL